MPNHTFHPFDVSLQGVNIIEASAGTGKTYGIASIYARLIVLEGQQVDNILVMTFTNAAVAELKQRLRSRLLDIEQMLTGKKNFNEPFMQELQQQIAAKDLPHDKILEHIIQQLNHFDKATISTIHQFCLEVLKDEAFLSGSPFHIDLVANHTQSVKQQFSQDFFRQYISPHPLNSWFFCQEKITPQSLLRNTQQYLQQPLLKKVFPTEVEQQLWINNLLDLQKALNHIAEKINYNHQQAFLSLIEEGILNRLKFRLNTYQSLFKLLSLPPLMLFSALGEKKYFDAIRRLDFEVSHIKRDYLSNYQDNVQQLFAKFQPLIQLSNFYEYYRENKEKALADWQLRFIIYLDQNIAAHKQRSLERSFDDLLVDVLTILLSDSQHTAQLIQNISTKYHYVLIDEFQDTDPIQYTIFQRLFIEQNTPVFFVGDPKQSIYQFRGADLNSYLKAKRNADHVYSMNTNYRSVNTLITALNALFATNDNPFKIKDIPYYPVQAHRTKAKIHGGNQKRTAFTLIKLNEKDDHKNKTELTRIAAYATADSIAQLLNEAQQGILYYGERKLEANDIAVLVFSHHQAQIVSKALRNRNIRSFKYEKELIYHTEEAKILLTLLKFHRKIHYINALEIDSYSDHDLLALNYLLSSPLWGATAAEIQQIHGSPQKLEKYLQTLKLFFNAWEQRGIYTAFQLLSEATDFENQLIQQQQERASTNFNQLVELLAEKEMHVQNTNTLVEWFEAQIKNPDLNTEEHTLRLESDENLVKIVTIHSSKGLQYPIVFCPFLWQYTKRNNTLLTADTDKGTLGYQQNLLIDKKAEEALRLIYVSLTRAEEQLILFTDDIKKDKIDELNPLQYLLRPMDCDHLWQSWQQWYQKHPELESIVTLKEILPEHTKLFVQNTTSDELASPQKRPVFNHPTTSNTSYSKLTKDLIAHPPPKYISQIATDNTDQPLNRFNFPRGPIIGSFLHEVLELGDAKTSLASQKALVRQKIIEYDILGYNEDELIQISLEILKNVWQASLNPNITLNSFRPEKTYREFKFMLHQAKDFSLEAINAWFLAQGWSDFCLPMLDRQQKNIYETFLTGAIDWVGLDDQQNLYIVDYKSNYLGDNLAAYAPDKLLEEILAHSYHLQATIYALAMYRYSQTIDLSIRQIYIRWLFLRGIDQNTNHGIWQWTLRAHQLEDLEARLS